MDNIKYKRESKFFNLQWSSSTAAYMQWWFAGERHSLAIFAQGTPFLLRKTKDGGTSSPVCKTRIEERCSLYTSKQTKQ